MHETFNDEISPWSQDPRNIFTIQYDQPKPKPPKKQSSDLDPHLTPIRNKRRILLNPQMPKQPPHNTSTKSYAPPPQITAKSHQNLILSRSQKSKLQLIPMSISKSKSKSKSKLKRFLGNKSTMFEVERKRSMEPVEVLDFVVKKYDRIRKLSKVMLKDVRMEEIFKKLCEIQNPSQRQNISLPKIQIRI